MVQRRRRNRKRVSWLIIIFLLFVVIIVGYLVWGNLFNNKEKDEPESSINVGDIQTVEKEIIEKEKVEGDKTDETIIEEEKKVVSYDGDDPNKSKELTGVITFSGISENDLIIRVNIDQYLSDGICSLSLMKDGEEEYNDAARIISPVATSTCEGFNVPLSEISRGSFIIIIRLSAGEKYGTINGEVDI